MVVTIFQPRGRTFLHVFFRDNAGRQRNLSLGTTDRDAAKSKAAAIVAQELNVALEAKKEIAVREELELLRLQMAEQSKLLRLIAHGGKDVTDKLYAEAQTEFLAEKRAEISRGHYRRLEGASRSLGEWCAKKAITHIGAVTKVHVETWLKEGGWTVNKTYNARLNDTGNFLRWAKDKGYSSIAAADEVKRRKVEKRGAPETLTLEQCRKLMRYVEVNFPHYVAYYALALFAGIRSSRGQDGSELRRVLEDVRKTSWEAQWGGPGYLWVRKPKTESGESGGARRAYISPNCKAWLDKYPSARFVGKKAAIKIQEEIQVPFNGLRHSAVTGYVTHTQELATACLLFGHDEATLRKHYLGTWSREDAAAFFQIMPS